MRKFLIVTMLSMTVLFLAQGQSFGQRKKRARTQRSQAVEPTSAQNAEANARRQSLRPFTPEEKAQLTARLFASQKLAARFRDERYRVLSISVAPDDKESITLIPVRRLAQVVLFNYTLGKATRLLVDASNAEVITEESLRGRPQSSAEEIQEAIKIIRQERTLARLIDERGVLEGGFIVDAPRGSPPNHRFIQMQLLTPDRLSVQRLIVVDLTAGTIASARASY